MRILFDNSTPRGLAKALQPHSVTEARAQGWDQLTNGELLEAAEAAGFDVSLRQTRTSGISKISRGVKSRSWS